MSQADKIARATAEARTKGAPAPFKRGTGRASFPRRMTLDLDDERYLFLRRLARESGAPAAGLVRAALDNLERDPRVRAEVVKTAQAQLPDL